MNEKYIPGGYKRRLLEGYIQYHQFKHPFLLVDKAKGANVIKDIEAERIVSKGFAEKTRLDGYISEIDSLFDFECLADLSDEQILYEVFMIKKNAFSNYYGLKYTDEKHEELNKIVEKTAAASGMKEIFGLFFGGQDERILKEDFEIESRSFLESLYLDITSQNGRIFVFAGNYTHLPVLKKVICELLPEGTAERTEFMLKSDPVFDEPHMEEFVRIFGCEQRKCFFDSKCYGADLSDESLSEWRDCLKAGDTVIFTGENMLTTSENAGFDYYVISAVNSDKAAKYTGKYPSAGEIRYVLEKVPCREYRFEKRYHGAERVNYSLDPHKWDDDRYFLNYYSETFDPDNFPEMVVKGASFEELMLQRDRVLGKIAAEELKKMGGNYLDGYYCLDDFEKLTYIPEREGNAVLMRGMKFDSSSTVMLKPLVAQFCGKECMDVRELSRHKPYNTETYFMLNFLYFATGNIKNLYNALRRDRPYENIGFDNFFVDYFNHFRDIRTESVPLYNKAVVEYRGKSGGIEMKRKMLGSGTVVIGEIEYSWDACCVNTEQEVPVAVFTPMMVEERGSEENFRSYAKPVGENRFNVVIIDNHVVCIREGNVLLPPLGLVISLNDMEFCKIRSLLELTRAENGYFISKDEIKVNFTGGKISPQACGTDDCWAFGGGTMLMENGVSLVENEEAALRNFKSEGWLNPLSMQTQETQVQNWVRGPRSVLGTTFGGGLFAATFSGRTKESKGARFDEIIRILQNEITGLKDVINLDGGASSCMGMIYRGEFFELNYPSMTTFNSAGMVRPLNSILLFGPG